MSEALQNTSQFLNKWSEVKTSYNTRDLITYALGIGCDEMEFLYENSMEFQPFVTYPIVLSFKGTDQDVVSFPSPAMAGGPPMPPLKGIKVGLDGERYIEKIKALNPEGGEITVRSKLIGIHARGSGASVETESQLVDTKTGEVYYKIISGAFLVGAKGFEDSGITNSEKVETPKRAPDAVLDMPTTLNQAIIYRLSGDYNPLHIDPDAAPMMGFPKPILHGLCSLGITARAVMKQFCGNDQAKFKAIKARFAKPVYPGQTLSVEMWKEGDRIILVSKVKETGQIALNNAYVLLEPTNKL